MSGGIVLTPASGGSLPYLPVVNALAFAGYDKTGTTDSSAAIAAAFATMGATPTGTLYLPGNPRISSPLVFDGGDATASSNSLTQLATAHPQHFAIVCDGAILADSGIGTAVTVKKFIGVKLDLRFAGGGSASDVALLLQNLYGLDLDLWAQDFAGLVCKADATTASNNLVSGRVRSLRAENCGQGINWKLINAFGVFDYIEIIGKNQFAGSIFQQCSDIDINFANLYDSTGLVDGLTFDGCNNFNHVVIEAGDRPTNSVVRVCSDSAPSNFGRLKLRASIYALAPPVCALMLDEVLSGDFEVITYAQSGVSGTDWGTIGVLVKGGGVNDVLRIRHHSLTRETTPMKIMAGGTTSTPNIRAEVDYRFCKVEGMLIDVGVTGGEIVVEGRMGQLNQSSTGNTAAINDASSAILDISGLQVPVAPNGGVVIKTDKTLLRTSRNREQYERTAEGIISETARPVFYATATALVSQTVYGALVGLKRGDSRSGCPSPQPARRSR